MVRSRVRHGRNRRIIEESERPAREMRIDPGIVNPNLQRIIIISARSRDRVRESVTLFSNRTSRIAVWPDKIWITHRSIKRDYARNCTEY